MDAGHRQKMSADAPSFANDPRSMRRQNKTTSARMPYGVRPTELKTVLQGERLTKRHELFRESLL
jgi:hypothetical protein